MSAQKGQKIFPAGVKKSLKIPVKDASVPAAVSSILASGCDTINYPVPDAWTLTYYATGEGGSDGFATGNNVYGDQEKAAYFNLSSSADIYLTKVWIGFCRSKQQPDCQSCQNSSDKNI